MPDMSNTDIQKENEAEEKAYKEAFDYFDWNRSGTIPTSVSTKHLALPPSNLLVKDRNLMIKILSQDLQYAMRRAGQNPTDIEVQDMLNKIDDGTGVMDLEDFLLVMREKGKEVDMETHFKDAFRVFSKDNEGRNSLEDLVFSSYPCRLYSC